MEEIGRYQILGELGSGGMGVVYRAHDPVLGRTVAIKRLKLSDLADPFERDTLRDRLAREARAAAALSHPNIVAIHDVVGTGDSISLVMECIEGQTLGHLMMTNPSLDIPRVLRIVREAAAGLDHAHRKNIVHRDVKPANIMLDEAGTVKIADFGIAKITTSTTRTQSAMGLITGTAGYMAPEQLRGADIDGHVDQFSLAVVAYEMFAQRRPFMADSLIALTHQVVFEPPPPLSSLRPGLGAGVDAVFSKALAKAPAARYLTCSAFASALESNLKSPVNETMLYPAIHPAPVTATVTTPPPLKPSSSKYFWLAAIAALIILVVAYETYMLRRSAPPNPIPVAQTPPVVEQPAAQKQADPTPAEPVMKEAAAAESPKATPTPSTPAVVKAGSARVGKDGQKYIWIPAGTFNMGCIPNDPECGGFAKPVHRVTISSGYWLAQTETTVAAYKKFSDATHREMPKAPKFNANWSLTDHPMVEVSWDDAVAYANWAGGRLPTEAEWEYAARGGIDGKLFPWGNDASHDQANFGDGTNGADERGAIEGKDKWINTSPVKSFPPNGFNLYDMAGNVSEWCSDWFGATYYRDAPGTDPNGPSSGSARVVRGGSWRSPARFLHTSYRGSRPQDDRGLTTGFRCVLK